MNAVGHRERSKTARHEAVHASVAIYLGHVPTEVRILPLPPGQSGYIQGVCFLASDVPSNIDLAVVAGGVLDGHGASGASYGATGDVENLAAALPDDAERERLLGIVSEIMKTSEFMQIRNRLARKLMFKDTLREREIRRIVEAVMPAARRTGP